MSNKKTKIESKTKLPKRLNKESAELNGLMKSNLKSDLAHMVIVLRSRIDDNVGQLDSNKRYHEQRYESLRKLLGANNREKYHTEQKLRVSVALNVMSVVFLVSIIINHLIG